MGKITIVPTPIGNLNDITFRAIEVLKNTDLILAEDTRKTSILLNNFQIKNDLKPYHKFNEHKQLSQIISKLKSGANIALVSDAGTPAISDPGFLLVRECVKEGIEIETLPGATAFVPAIVNSGFPCEKFCFEGFLPQKKGRHKRLTELSQDKRTIILYESPHRLIKMLNQIIEYFGEDRIVSVSRELTKIHEETKRGTAKELISYFEKGTVKGEIVIVIKGID